MAVYTVSGLAVGYTPPGGTGAESGPYPGTFVFPITDDDSGTFTARETFLQDEILETGFGVFNSDAARSAAVELPTAGAIPLNADIMKVEAFVGPGLINRTRLLNGQTLEIFTYLKDSRTVLKNHGVILSAPYPADAQSGGIAALQRITLELLTNSKNGAWTPVNIFDEAVGIYWPSLFIHTAQIAFSEMGMDITFTQRAPNVATAAATNVGDESVRLNAAINPNGATTEFPVQVSFRWGLHPEALFNTLTGEALTGSVNVISGANLSGLDTNTTYFFQAVGTYDGTDVVAPNIESFTTGKMNQILRVF